MRVPVLLLLSVLRFSGAEDVVPEGGSSGNSSRTTTSISRTNSTHPDLKLKGLNADSSMIQRALYVLIGITVIGVLYFLVRAVRLKKPVHRKKYGLLSNQDDSVEMDGMDSEEDDTLYEARSLRS